MQKLLDTDAAVLSGLSLVLPLGFIDDFSIQGSERFKDTDFTPVDALNLVIELKEIIY